MKAIDQLTEIIIGCAIEVHRQLGPGLLESTYQACLYEELVARGLRVQREVSIPIVYRGRRLKQGYRIDMIVEDAVVVEIKTASRFEPIFFAQVRSYLRHSGKEVGLLINFETLVLRTGVRRVELNYPRRSS